MSARLRGQWVIQIPAQIYWAKPTILQTKNTDNVTFSPEE